MQSTAKFKTAFKKCPLLELLDQYPDVTFISVSIPCFDVGKCKNTYITSILGNNKSLYDPQELLGDWSPENFNFFANRSVRLSKGNPPSKSPPLVSPWH